MAYQVVERCELNIGERVGNRYVVEKVLGEGRESKYLNFLKKLSSQKLSS